MIIYNQIWSYMIIYDDISSNMIIYDHIRMDWSRHPTGHGARPRYQWPSWHHAPASWPATELATANWRSPSLGEEITPVLPEGWATLPFVNALSALAPVWTSFRFQWFLPFFPKQALAYGVPNLWKKSYVIHPHPQSYRCFTFFLVFPLKPMKYK